MAYYTNFSLISVFLLLQLAVLSHCTSDPSPLQDFCVTDLNSSLLVNGFPCKKLSDVTSDDFFSDKLQHRGTEFNALNVNLTQANVYSFPGLNTLGLSMNRVELLRGGLNPPHIHPRASELALVTEGKLFVGLVSTQYILYSKTVTAGQLFVIPPGLVHFELNIGDGNALFYATFSSQNPGVQKIAPALFSSTPLIPDEVLTTAFNVNKTIIDIIKANASVLIKNIVEVTTDQSVV